MTATEIDASLCISRRVRPAHIHMYGMINKAFEEMICSKFGRDTWDLIRNGAASKPLAFVTLNQYPDELTYALVRSASETLATAPNEMLLEFGRYWIGYATRSGYAELLALSGRTLFELLGNLDKMHARVGLSFQGFKPPSFACTEVTAHSLKLHYYSDRQGLEPMIVGLIEGLSELFKERTRVSWLSDKDHRGGAMFLVERIPE